jgi:regulator of sirC expression with transglutaminase-like and TPR domain
MRLEKEGDRIIYDTFQAGKILEAPDLRSILKTNLGKDAELSNQYYDPCTNRDILLRLQNNIKYRLIDSEHYQEALEIVDLMMVFAPDDFRLKLDLAVLLARLERPKAAIENLEIYIEKMPIGIERREAEVFLTELRIMLN